MSLRRLDLGPQIAGSVFLSDMPGWRRPLADDVAEAQSVGIERVACLVPRAEIGWRSPDYFQAVIGGNLPWDLDSLPIVDGGVPEHEELVEFIDRLAAYVNSGQTVLLHCAGGIGRTGMVAICLLVRLGSTAEFGKAAVIQAGSCPETPQQEALIAWYVTTRAHV